MIKGLHSPCMEVEVIELVKPKNAGLGLIIGSREDRDGVFVDEVVMNGAAHKGGRIRSGDKILAINGQDVSAAKQDLVALQLQGCKGKISLTVGHAVGMSPVKDRSPDISKYPLPLSIGPPVEVHSQQSPPSYPGYSNNSDSMDSSQTSSSSLQATSVNQYSTDSYPPSYRSSSPPVRLSPQVTCPSHDPPPYPSGTSIQHHMGSGDAHSFPSPELSHKEITLHRGPNGFGFTFVGGNETTSRTLPKMERLIKMAGYRKETGWLLSMGSPYKEHLTSMCWRC